MTDALARPTLRGPLGPKRCRSCSAEILWTITESGRRMPVDLEPTPNGNVAIWPGEDDDGKPAWRSMVAGPLEPVEGCSNVRRVSHFSTCPDSAKHRRTS